jgi:hypothetical protein
MRNLNANLQPNWPEQLPLRRFPNLMKNKGFMAAWAGVTKELMFTLL